jgi:hypothetical protein
MQMKTMNANATYLTARQSQIRVIFDDIDFGAA